MLEPLRHLRHLVVVSGSVLLALSSGCPADDAGSDGAEGEVEGEGEADICVDG